VFRVNPQAGGKLHQVGKPLPLMEEIVAHCGQRILDPFMGSATTGAACLKQEKHFTGIEASRHYFEVAVQRLRAK
jgi:site-specific DNA-methyltransferase (adenine-specific)